MVVLVCDRSDCDGNFEICGLYKRRARSIIWHDGSNGRFVIDTRDE